MLPVGDFSGEYQILVDGTLFVPLLGTFPVQGLTLTQLTEFLTQQYRQYVKRLSVTVGLVSPRPLKLAIAGEINNPGSYLLPIEGRQKFPTVTQLIQQAGGLTTVADLDNVTIKRQFQ